MTQSEFDLSELLDAIRAGGDIDVIRRSVELVLQALIGLGRRYRGQTIAMLIAGRHIRVLNQTGDLVRDLDLDPTRDYEPQQ